MGAAGYGRQRIGNGEAAIVVAVPVNTNLFAGRPHNFFDGKFHEVERAIRSSVANRVAEHDGARTISNGGRVKAFHGFGVRARSEERRVGKEGRSRWSPYH